MWVGARGGERWVWHDRREMRGGSCGVAACLGLAMVLAAQEQVPQPRELGEDLGPAELEKRWEATGEFCELVWRVNEEGRLFAWPDPSSAVAEMWHPLPGWQRGDGVDPWASWFVDSRRADAAEYLLGWMRSPGQLLGAVDAQRHFERMGRAQTDAELRQFVVRPAEAATAALRRREVLDQQVATLLLKERAVEAALGELRFLAEQSEDAWLRWQAEDALHALDDSHPAPARVALREVDVIVPQRAELWLYVDHARVRARSDLAERGRAHGLQWTYGCIRGAGGTCSPFTLAGAQLLADRPGEIPFELARVCGRMRLDQALLAFDALPGGTPRLVWAAASGAFEVDVLASHLATLRIPPFRERDRIIATKWVPDYVVEARRDVLVVRHESLELPPESGEWPELLREAQSKHAAFAAALQPKSRLAPMHPFLLPAGGKLFVTHVPFRAEVETDASVPRMQSSLRRAASALRLTPPSLLPRDIRGPWLRLLDDAKPEASPSGGSRLLLTADDADPLDLLPLLLVRD